MASDIFRWNPLRHHAGYIREYLRFYIPADLKKQLNVLGNSRLDLYCGPLSIHEIEKEIRDQLEEKNLLSRSGYRQFLKKNGGFHMIGLSDRSSWILREGNDPVLYVHIHPGRNVINTMRVKSTTLKTAIGCHVALREGIIAQVDLKGVNRVRQDLLGLSPIKRIHTDTQWDKIFMLLG